MVKIMWFCELDSPEVLKIDDLLLADPGEGEVRFQVEALSFNRAGGVF